MSVEDLFVEVCASIKAVIDAPPVLPDIVKRLIDNEPVFENKVMMISGTLIGMASRQFLESQGVSLEGALSAVKSASESAVKELVDKHETVQTQNNQE